MADSLVLTGTRQVTKHKGNEMLRLDYPRGGNTWHLKRWWVQGNGTVYVDCTVFKVTGAAGSGYLAIASSASTNLRIDHDGSFGFDFFYINEVERAALFTDTFELVEHYVFPNISGGKVMTVTPADGGTIGGGGGGGGGTTGVVTGVSVAAGGTGYSDATGVAVSGGSGSGLTVNITVTTDAVTSATVASGGQDYVAGETVTVSGGGGDATLTVSV
jgi:hypothetical protein